MKFTTAALPLVAAACVVAIAPHHDSLDPGKISGNIACTDDDCVYKSPEYKIKVAKCLEKNCRHDFKLREPNKYGRYSNTFGPRGIIVSGSHHSSGRSNFDPADVDNPFILQEWGQMTSSKPPHCAPFCLRALVNNMPMKFCKDDETADDCACPSEVAQIVSECCFSLVGNVDHASRAAEWILEGCTAYVDRYGSGYYSPDEYNLNEIDGHHGGDPSEYDEGYDRSSNGQEADCDDIFNSENDNHGIDCSEVEEIDHGQSISECSDDEEYDHNERSGECSENENSDNEDSDYESSGNEDSGHEDYENEDSDPGQEDEDKHHGFSLTIDCTYIEGDEHDDNKNCDRSHSVQV
ncbi:Fc.00g013550.m01.CDS01 [Cosmosporella sp. VM-42]